MANNFVYPGEHLPFTAGAALESGELFALGALAAVSLTKLANGESGTAAVEGVWEVPKTSATVIAAGDLLTFDASAGEMTTGGTPASGDLVACAVATEAAGNGVTTVRAKLTPGTATVTA